MLDIIICEDNKKEREGITSFIRAVLSEDNLNASIVLSTENPYDVIDHVKNFKKNTGIYFLDISLKSDIDGLNLAKVIRKMDLEGYIIFVTTHSELRILTFEYKVEALDYIIKDDILKVKNRIKECLLKACERDKESRGNKGKSIVVNYGSRTINISLDDILFFETSAKIHKVKVHTANQQMEFYGTLKEIEEVVDENFYRSHKSYLINLKNIKEIDRYKKVVVMLNGEKCYVSSKNMRGLLEKCQI